MATIDKYNKQAWVNNSTKISAENLDKVETGLETLSEQTQQYVSEWADEWATFKSTELSQISSDISDNTANIESAFSALSSHYNRLEDLDVALVDLNTTIGTASCSTDLSLGTWQSSGETPQLLELPTAQQFNVKLDLTISYDSVSTSGTASENLLKKKRKPLWEIREDSSSSISDPVGVGPGTVTPQSADELWANLVGIHSNASWENIKSDENNSVLGKPVDLNDDIIFAPYSTSWGSGIFSTYNYDSNIDFVLICYNQSLNKYYFVNLGDLSIGMSLKYSLGTYYTTSGYATCLAVEQTHVNWETLKLPPDTSVFALAFMIKQSTLEDLGISADDAFYYLGDWSPAECVYQYVFRMIGTDGTTDSNCFALLETGTYYLPADTRYDYENTRSSYKVGNSVSGPYTSEGDLFIRPNWVSNFNNPKAVYKFTYPTGTSNAYKVLELCQKHTDDDIEQIAKNTLNDLISFGSGDPTTSTNGMFYFKINSTD